jgi:spore germination protein YaaH
MGYDYRVAGSSPGASSPLDSRTGEKDLAWSLDLYASLGVPTARTLLGLPLYGVTWPVAGPVVGAPETGRGDTWILRRHLDLLQDPAAVRWDEVEQVEVYLLGSDGSMGPPQPLASPSGSPATGGPPPATPAPMADITWQAVYVDSPATLAPKMGLARDRGLAGVGFWAIGYERGLPGYTDLIGRFAAGEPLE